MKKFSKAILGLATFMALTGCSSNEINVVDNIVENEDTVVEVQIEDKISIVCTIFPEYDWIKEIIGDNIGNFELTVLLDNSVDLHNYQPTASDIVKISEADMFVYVGGESDNWVEDVLVTANNEELLVVNLFDILGENVKEEEFVEGMEHDHEEDDHDHELDEHVWLSLRNAGIVCEYLTNEISLLDEENATIYQANYEGYMEELEGLDAQYAEVVENATFDTLVFADRFPFRYLTDDYGLNYFAAFSGCSAEIEASFETIVFLAEKTSELGVNYICTIEGVNHKIAETVVQNTTTKDQEIVVLNSMQSVSSTDINNGLTYLDVMAYNLEILKTALN